MRADCGDNAGELERRQIKIDECEALIEKLVEKGDWHEAERRRLHNTIQVGRETGTRPRDGSSSLGLTDVGRCIGNFRGEGNYLMNRYIDIREFMGQFVQF